MLSAREKLNGFGRRRPGIGQGLAPLTSWLAATGVELDSSAARLSYWRNIRRVTVILLVVWLAMTLALPWFATELNQFRIGRFPLGFWLTSQGAVGIYVVLIVAYIWAVEMIEDAWHDANEVATSSAAVTDGHAGLSSIAAGRRHSGD
jgi:putative solute:sodium symporter small subunit